MISLIDREIANLALACQGRMMRLDEYVIESKSEELKATDDLAAVLMGMPQ